MSNFGKFRGQDFLSLDLPQREWLIEKLIKEGDSVILVGNEKSGKSLFIFQLITSLTTCHPFLDKYDVPKPKRVVYVQLEGELQDSQDRMKRMIKTLDLNPELLHFFFSPPLQLQETHSTKQFTRDLLLHMNPDCPTVVEEGITKISDMSALETYPDLVIIDPIYFAFSGSLNKDEIIRQFVGNMRVMKDILKNCAIILVHHTHKTKWDYKGHVIDEGDEALFGSKFLKAWADHILMFMYDKKSDKRSLLCNTQRSGNIIKECQLLLVEPDPLYFKEDTVEANKDLFVMNLLQKPEYKDGLDAQEVCTALGISRAHFYNSIKKPLAEEVILKLDGKRPVKYVFNYAKFSSTAPLVR